MTPSGPTPWWDAAPGPALPPVEPAGRRSETMVAILGGAGLAVLLVAGLLPATGTSLTSRIIAAGSCILAAAAAWVQARRSAVSIPTVVTAAGALTAVWLLSQSTGGIATAVSGILLGFFLGVPFARLRVTWGPLPRRAAMAAAVIVLVTAFVAHPAIAWLVAALAMSGPLAVWLGRPVPSWSARWTAWGAVVSAVVAVTAVLGTWVGANSAGATVTNHGSRRSMDVAITFDGISDTATLQRLVGALDDHRLRATFFVPPPELPAAAQVETVLLHNNQLLASEADPSEWATWLDPNFRRLSRDQRTFVRNIGVCPTFFRSPDGRTSPMMATGARHHGMTVVSSDVQASGRGDPARLVRRVLTHVRSGSIIALRLDTNTASNTAVVEALPQILQGMLARGLHVVPLDQLLHTAPYAARC